MLGIQPLRTHLVSEDTSLYSLARPFPHDALLNEVRRSLPPCPVPPRLVVARRLVNHTVFAIAPFLVMPANETPRFLAVCGASLSARHGVIRAQEPLTSSVSSPAQGDSLVFNDCDPGVACRAMQPCIVIVREIATSDGKTICIIVCSCNPSSSSRLERLCDSVQNRDAAGE